MLALVYGGSGSGKSEFAEQLANSLADNKKLIYIATMQPYGNEALKKIDKHRKMRQGKGFETIECYCNLHKLTVEKNSVVLLECLSNLVANEMFDCENKNLKEDIVNGVIQLEQTCSVVVVVTNDVFNDGINYDEATRKYISTLAEVNNNLSGIADSVTEVVCGIPIKIKG